MILIKIVIKPSQRVSGMIRHITVYVWRLAEEKEKKTTCRINNIGSDTNDSTSELREINTFTTIFFFANVFTIKI